MRKVLCVGLLLALVCAAAETVLAHEDGGGRQGRQRAGRQRGGRGQFVERMKTQLGLTDEQVEKMKAVQADFQKKMQAAGNDRDKRRALWGEQQAYVMCKLCHWIEGAVVNSFEGRTASQASRSSCVIGSWGPE